MEEKKVIIFGKDTWPYTSAAREEYAQKGYKVDYRNVLSSEENMELMLKYSKGNRNVPVIILGENIKIGYGGTW